MKRLKVYESWSDSWTDSTWNASPQDLWKLETLEIFGNFDGTLDLTGMIDLTSLDLRGTRFTEIKGKELIFPRLKSLVVPTSELLVLHPPSWQLLQNLKTFSCSEVRSADIEVMEEFSNYLNISLGIPYLKDEIGSFTIGDRVKSLELIMKVKELKGSFPVERTFLNVSLVNFGSFNNLSLFQNVQIIDLRYCYCINDISSIAQVPYITIVSCEHITDFSCFGPQQHYLCLEQCSALTNKDVEENFPGISWLRISAAVITKLRLSNNRYLEVNYCDDLTEIVLEGPESYIRVELEGCSSLEIVRVTGSVYHLLLADPDKLLEENSLRNCQNITKLD
jgi:hypothetical protein